MADWHLQEIRNALEAKGWRIIAEHPGDDYRISATWEIERSTKKPPVFIDFEGLDDLVTLPLEQSYDCRIRGHDSLGLYLGRKGEGGSRRRQNWQNDLKQFLNELKRVDY
jgi:hypothetical protein